MKQEITVSKSPWRREELDQKGAELAALCEERRVVAAYVFGSVARSREPQRVTTRSDLDLAILLPADWTREQRSRQANLLEVELVRLFGRRDIDLVVANDAPLLLRRNITRHRDVLYGRDAEERVGFDWRTHREFLDTEPLRRRRQAALLRRIQEGRFGVRPTDR
ncbi:MAG: nucleotidyltransferase domain-containing protein [Armatimonadetes bacterium]|nr:nucleotidyltransferase domain-containing protein [Armatimonadota bacterium]